MLYVQYSNASNFNNLLYGNESYKGLNSLLNINYEDFVNYFFDIRTANTQALDNWGIILNTSRNYYGSVDNHLFGFNQEPNNDKQLPQNFNNGAFYSGQTQFISMADSQYRSLLLMRYQTYNSNMSLLSIAQILNTFFKNLYLYTNDEYYADIKVSVTDNAEPMTITYTFTKLLNVFLSSIFISSEFSTYYLPKPMGVLAQIVY